MVRQRREEPSRAGARQSWRILSELDRRHYSINRIAAFLWLAWLRRDVGSGLRSGRDSGASDAVASLGGQLLHCVSGRRERDGHGRRKPAHRVPAGPQTLAAWWGWAATTGTGSTKGCCSVGADAAGEFQSQTEVALTERGLRPCVPRLLPYGTCWTRTAVRSVAASPRRTVNPTCPCDSGTAQTAYGCLTCGYCANGYVLDANGCPTCSCNPPSCPARKCASCLYGYVNDASGCPTCTCLPDRACRASSSMPPSAAPAPLPLARAWLWKWA